MFDELKDTLIKVRSSKYYPVARSVLRGLCLYLLFALIFLFAAEVILTSFVEVHEVSTLPFLKVWRAAILILFFVLILNSVCFLFAVFDSETRRRFFSTRWQKKEEADEEDPNPARNLYFVEFITLCLCCFLFPVWHAYDSVIAALPFSFQVPEIIDRLILTVLFSALAFFSVLHVGNKAESYWLKKQSDAYKKKGYVASNEVNKKAYGKLKFLLYAVGYFLGYYIVSGFTLYLVIILYSLLRSFLLILQEWTFFIVVGAIVFLFVGRKLLKRIKFYVRLVRLCKGYGFRIVEKKHPLLSLLFEGKSYQLAIQANGTVYYVRMIATLRKKNRLRFLPDGTFKRISGVHLPTPQVMVQSRFAMGAVYVDRSHVDEREMFRFERTGSYAFDCKEGGKKILLLNPVPSRAMLGAATLEGADHGDMIGEYSVYGGTAFLNALKNDAFYFDKHKNQ